MNLLATMALMAVNPEATLNALRSIADTIGERPKCSVTVTFQGVSNGEDQGDVFRFDHNTNQWTMISANGEPPEENDRNPPQDHYLGSVKFSKLPMNHVSTTDSVHAYRGEKFNRGAVKINGRDLSEKTAIDLHVISGEDGPIIQRQIMTNIKPIRIPMIAYIPSFRLEKEYRMEPSYGMVVAKITTSFKMDAMGKNRDSETVSHYSDYDCPK